MSILAIITIKWRIVLAFLLVTISMVVNSFSIRFFQEFKEACKEKRKIKLALLIFPNGVVSFFMFLYQLVALIFLYALFKSIMTDMDFSQYSNFPIYKSDASFFSTILLIFIIILVLLKRLLAVLYKVQKNDYKYFESNFNEALNYYKKETGVHKNIGAAIDALLTICQITFVFIILLSIF